MENVGGIKLIACCRVVQTKAYKIYTAANQIKK